MLDPQHQKQLGEWGFNAIRLGAMWSGVEPSESQVFYQLKKFRGLQTIFRSMKPILGY